MHTASYKHTPAAHSRKLPSLPLYRAAVHTRVLIAAQKDVLVYEGKWITKIATVCRPFSVYMLTDTRVSGYICVCVHDF